ncbi:MAG: dTMP kinase [Patescibacteria group bacterium]
MKGLFIVIEGSNSSGKTTITKLICQWLKKQKFSVVQTKEPTNTKIGRFCRSWENKRFTFIRLCLLTGDRYFHLYREIIPNLRKGNIVVSDRYFVSSLVWQQIDGLPLGLICFLNAFILIPDLTIIIRASQETQRKRRRLKKGDLKDKEAQLEIDLYQQVVKYLCQQNHRICQVDNNGKLDKTLGEIHGFIKELIFIE